MKKYVLGFYIMIQLILLISLIVLFAIEERDAFQDVAILMLMTEMTLRGTTSEEFRKAYEKAEQKDDLFKKTGQEDNRKRRDHDE